MDGFNPTRLDLARRRRGLTKRQLAETAGVSTRILTAYERGDRDPSEATVRKLAAAVRFPPDFFDGDDIEEPRDEGVSFRSLSNMTSSQRDQAIGAAAIALRLDDWIRERFELPTANVPRLKDADAETAAEAVRAAWGVEQRRAPNMVHLLEAHGVRVFSLVQECAEVDAFSFWRGDIPYVFLNQQKTPEHSRMDAAHELGHLVLHVHGELKGRTKAEAEAKEFASAFLMPRRSVLAGAPHAATVPQILKAKTFWGVSAMGLTYRMQRLRLLSEWQARSAYIQLTRLGYRSGEPIGIERETSQIFTKVFAALRAEGVTRASVARHLCVPVDELNRTAFGLVVATRGEPADPESRPHANGRPDLRIVVQRD